MTSPSKPRLTTSAMIASIAEEGQETRAAPFGHALVKLAEQRPEIVGMTADLSKYTDLHIFAQAHPERFFQMGMAEQLLMGAAGGMAKEGFIPFATTYAVFASRRGLLPAVRVFIDFLAEKLPPLLEAVRRDGRRVLWVCDAMHGNTESGRAKVP